SRLIRARLRAVGLCCRSSLAPAAIRPEPAFLQSAAETIPQFLEVELAQETRGRDFRPAKSPCEQEYLCRPTWASSFLSSPPTVRALPLRDRSRLPSPQIRLAPLVFLLFLPRSHFS